MLNLMLPLPRTALSLKNGTSDCARSISQLLLQRFALGLGLHNSLALVLSKAEASRKKPKRLGCRNGLVRVVDANPPNLG